MMEVTRIVRLSFKEDKTGTFLKIFEETYDLIRNFEGCNHLELKQDFHHSNVFYTVSKWASQQALDEYRYSPLFKTTWSKTKILFDSKALVYSLVDVRFQ
jgi:quinol monooxygenase YgiN